MKKYVFPLIVLLLVLTLAFGACGVRGSEARSAGNEAPPEPTAEPTAEPTPEPPRELTLGSLTIPVETEELDLSGSGATLEELMSVSDRLSAVRKISLGVTDARLEQLRAVEAAYPQAELSWSAVVLGEEIDCRAEILDLTAATDADTASICAALAVLPEVRTLTLAPEGGLTTLSFDSLSALADAAPQAELNCRFELYGKTADWTTEELRYAFQDIGNECVGVFRRALPYLRSLKLLRLEECGISDHDGMAALRADFPDTNVVWNVYLSGYPFMTDTTLIHFEMLKDEDTYLLQYLPDVLYLDIGHDMAITNIEFVKYLPKVTTVILSLTNLSDISPIANCPEITFFECFTTPVEDISALAKLEKLEYLNLGNDWNLRDLSPLYELKNLKLVRLCEKSFTHLTQADVDALQEHLPDTVLSTVGGHAAFSGGWRFNPDGSYTERYALLRQQCLYDLPWVQSLSNSPSREG